MMNIRTAQLRDIPSLQVFQEEAWFQDYLPFLSTTYAQKGYDTYSSRDLIAERIQTSPCYLVAEQDNRLAGCIEMQRIDDTTLELWWLHVSGNFRNQKLGQQIVKYALSMVPASTRIINVTTFKNNVPAIGFYQRLGFTFDEFYYDQFGDERIDQCRLKYQRVTDPSNGSDLG
jgi:ribosomal protein S18 acetylase RimI-like enzyme